MERTGWSRMTKRFGVPDDFSRFALSRSRFAPVCGAREAQARQRAALIKGGLRRLYLTAAATPPVSGGVLPVPDSVWATRP